MSRSRRHSDLHTQRPGTDEYNEFYAGYVAAVPGMDADDADLDDGDFNIGDFNVGDIDIADRLEAESEAGLDFYSRIPEAKHDHRYAEGKWTLRQVLGHVVDTERIFSYRLMCIARGDETPLPGMDQNEYMAGADFGARSWQSLLDEYEHLRGANVALVRSLGAEAFDRRGTASGFPISVRALAWILAGHEIHHRGVVAERYLDG